MDAQISSPSYACKEFGNINNSGNVVNYRAIGKRVKFAPPAWIPTAMGPFEGQCIAANRHRGLCACIVQTPVGLVLRELFFCIMAFIICCRVLLWFGGL